MKNSYLESCHECKECSGEKEQLSQREQMEQFMFLGLRKTVGISKFEFQNKFGVEIEEMEIIKLTELGLDVSNQVMVEFV